MSQTKSISSHSKLLVLLVVTLISGVHCIRINNKKDNPKKNEPGSCSGLKNLWTNKGMEINQLPKLSMKNESLQFCGQGPTCCTEAIEDKLISLSLSEVSLDQKLDKIKQSLSTVGVRYNSFCIDLINKSAIDLDDMFQKTYGELYKQESHIFTELFNKLRAYYSRGHDPDLIKVFEKFFRTLMQKMFALLNAHYSFDDKYMKCVVEHMDSLRPFHDVPQKLSNQVKRAMVAARTFHEGLKVGREVITNLQKVKITQVCLKDYSQMTVCPYCSGLNYNVRPCGAYCLKVLTGCYSIFNQLDQPWNEYLTQMRKVMERLEGPFHLVGIISPINVKISEAIMNYQERNEDVNKKVFIGCGDPSLILRSKRSNPSQSYPIREVRSSDRTGLGDLDQILKEVRDKILSSNEIFTDLPESTCAPLLVSKNSKGSSNSTPSEDNCWNGTAKARYIKPQSSGGPPGLDIVKDESLIKHQIEKLMSVSSKLTKSFEGLDVVQDDDAPEGSGGNGDTEDGSGGSGRWDDEDYLEEHTTPLPSRRYHHEDKAVPPFNPVTHKVPYLPTSRRTSHPRMFFSSAPHPLVSRLGLFWQFLVCLVLRISYCQLLS